MNYSEQELEDYMYEMEFVIVNQKKIYVYSRQVIINNFRIDMVGIDEDKNIYIFELKKGSIDGNALSQVLNYMYYAKSYFNSEELNKNVYGVLVGSDIDKYTFGALNILKDIFYLETYIELDFMNHSTKRYSKKDDTTKGFIDIYLDIEHPFSNKEEDKNE